MSNDNNNDDESYEVTYRTEDELKEAATEVLTVPVIPGAVALIIEPYDHGFIFRRHSTLKENHTLTEEDIGVAQVSSILMYIIANKSDLLNAIAEEMATGWTNNIKGNA